ncbi:MAG TPA: YggS family pyridoxal phosphate-dependent enzyme [Thermoanaerobaculia bacterium]|nr:YggS family pyridoxal phosphate-dependent enzyme [Thermoanaerobaculia bacterium]
MTPENPVRRASDIPANIRRVNDQIEGACSRAGRSFADVTLVAVSKTFPASAIDIAIEAGVTNIGENRVQEFKDKISAIHGRARWHMIGHLQSNKARDACRLFHVVQSVDSIDVAQRLSRETVINGLTIDVMIQVNIGLEEQKSGFAPDAVADAQAEMKLMAGLKVVGLMTIQPQGDELEARQYFARMKKLFDASAATAADGGFVHLSMGMSADFEAAIEEGSTMIRVGRGIFGTRV